MSILLENNFSEIQMLSESDDAGKKNWYINGIFAQADVVNRNKRIYPERILDEAMSNYITEYVTPGRAVAELAHPSNTTINLDRIAAKIESLQKDGKSYHGKAKVLNTPCGQIVQGLLEGGVKLGVSTRADGSVKANNSGINEVQQGLRMAAIDIVANPSCHAAMVDGIMESIVIDSMSEDSMFIESIKQDIRTAKSTELQEAKVKAIQKFLSYLKG
jgi:hypothetical protein